VIAVSVIPFAASPLLAALGGRLGRRLSPPVAVPLLAIAALATALATGIVLSLAGFSALARLPWVAAEGGWPLTGDRPLSHLPAAWGIACGCLAVALLAAALAWLGRAARELVTASRACRGLAVGAGRLVVLPDPRPAAYTVPAGAGRVVVSTGMLALLRGDERRALLAHERAHLRHHHALYLAIVRLAAAANPLLRPLVRQVRLQAELWADQVAAAETGDPAAVARALARASLAASRSEPVPAIALAIGQSEAGARVTALLRGPARQSRWAVAVALALTMAPSAAALSLTWTTHQQIEIAQLASAQARARARRLGPRMSIWSASSGIASVSPQLRFGGQIG
jgi:Zn-dependent protease with chaperone function